MLIPKTYMTAVPELRRYVTLNSAPYSGKLMLSSCYCLHGLPFNTEDGESILIQSDGSTSLKIVLIYYCENLEFSM
jgi:hypothetical protein